jgi:hypothetical protein
MLGNAYPMALWSGEPMAVVLLDVLYALEVLGTRGQPWADPSAVADDLLERDTSHVEQLLDEATKQALVERRNGPVDRETGYYDPEYCLSRSGSMFVAEHGRSA